MRIVIAGGHGKIALRLARILAARGEEVAGLIRNPEHAADVTAAGAVPVVCDLEQASEDDVAAAVGRADAVVFAAGAGPGSGRRGQPRRRGGGACRGPQRQADRRADPLRQRGPATDRRGAGRCPEVARGSTARQRSGWPW
ncbi:MAG TPA: NAD(P)H-binding protein [Solirubrobacteraceae bacterium]|nr:NAD(P)H-binding protein [Solirubrobacteraceae bacterium]